MDLFSFISTLFAFAVIVPTCLISTSIIATVFWIAMLVRVIQNERADDKTPWILVVLFLHGIGALVYWFVRARHDPRSRHDFRNIIGFSALGLTGLCVLSLLPIFPTRATPYYSIPTSAPSVGIFQQTLTALPISQRQTAVGRTLTSAAQQLTSQQAQTLSAFDKTKTSGNQTGTALAAQSTQTKQADDSTQTATLWTPTATVPSRTPTRFFTVTRSATPTRTVRVVPSATRKP
jgi:hypothetical protein